jgi:hypothetical protein
VAEGHRAAARVDAVHVGVVLALPGRHDGGEGLVDLDVVDVVDRDPVALEQLRRRRDRALEHLHGVAADRGLVDDPRPRREAELLGLVGAHEQHGRRAVGDLRRVRRGDLAVRLEDRLELGQRLDVRVGADALVGAEGVAVDLDLDDLAGELALLGRLGGEPVRAHGELVELGARDLPLVGDHLGAQALADDVVLLHQLGGEGVAVLLLGGGAVGERDVAHVLDARADDDVMDAGGDQGGAEVDGLLSRAALAVDGRGGRLDRQALLQPRVAGDVEGLLAELLHAARDDVLDLGGIHAGAAQNLGVGLAEEVGGVGVLVVALLLVAAADRRANGLDDDDLAALLLAHSRDIPSKS